MSTGSVAPNKGFVAMLNLSKDRVEQVFCDGKAASEDRNFKTGAAVSKALNHGTQLLASEGLCKGYRWRTSLGS